MKIKLIIAFVILSLGCKKVYYYPDKTIEILPTKLLAHRGGANLIYRDNTLDGIKAALKVKDGIEVDIQFSKDETIWLSHSNVVEACNKTFNCFVETRDKDIMGITTCNGKDISYTQLESVFKYMKDSFPDKYISLDLKDWTPCSLNSLDVEGLMRYEGEIAIKLAERYGIAKNVKIESESTSVLDYIKSDASLVETYIVAFGDLERGMLIALKQGYSGISFKNNFREVLTKEKIDLLHKKGLKIMVWNLNSNDEIANLTEMGVDYIQMDL